MPTPTFYIVMYGEEEEPQKHRVPELIKHFSESVLTTTYIIFSIQKLQTIN